MALERPKILSVVTIPTGGWDLEIDVSDGGTYNKNVNVTLAAGDYFVAWDSQDDDFLWELQRKVSTEVVVQLAGTNYMAAWIDTNHKVNLQFVGTKFVDATGNNDVRIDWTAADGPSIAAVLGFDSSAADTSTAVDNPTFTADWHHAYGWYADDDGWIEDKPIEDISEVDALQVRALGGKVTTQHVANRFSNRAKLNFVTRSRTYSRNVNYGSAPVHPYARNKGLECWWNEAKQGKRFRFYREGRILGADDTTSAVQTGTNTARTNTTMTDSAKAWTTEPQNFIGMLLQGEATVSGVTYEQRGYISANTATVLTLPDYTDIIGSGTWVGGTSKLYYIYDQRYDTYVLNLEEMNTFEPTEIPNIDRYEIEIPMFKYVA